MNESSATIDTEPRWSAVRRRLERMESSGRGTPSLYSLIGSPPDEGGGEQGNRVAGAGLLENRLLLKVSEVAEILGLGQTKTWAMVSSGEIPSIKVGGSRRVPVDRLKAWVAAKEQEVLVQA
jgi:excisionase family DNA binding protein